MGAGGTAAALSPRELSGVRLGLDSKLATASQSAWGQGMQAAGPPQQRLTAPAQPGLAGLPLGSTLLEIHSLRGSRRPGEVLSTSCVLTPYSRDQIQQLPFADWKTGPEKPEEAGC